ncbi:hypothetical protein AB204_13050 [Xenorhabdus khoisanae]|uniref:Uncharacterized protein n=1 Tax=Xenorhabdus khoisanae TaxID=880157 RepID=A0A0J5FRW0_9GAMM|nr:hypothetical protein [Xenorhabdus khoisanae]KMJ44697.1 hypothetical protein AB204_13050 [Xenorhabdus khoisanae]
MSNDMIEQINATLESAEQLKSAGANEITLDLDSYITILRRLAEYENMEPVACYNLIDGEIRKSIFDFDADKTIYARPLYFHPNK